MSLRAKLLVLVATAGLGLVLVMVSSALIGLRETRELKAIQGRLLPKVVLGPRLEADFERLARTMQDAVAAQDRQTLDEAASIRTRIFERLAATPGAVSTAHAELIRRRIDDYYDTAQDVSRRLIDQETGEEMLAAIALMQAKQSATTDALTQATSLDYGQLTAHFAAINAAQSTAMRLRLGISSVCLTVVLFLSIKFSREVLSVVTNLSLGFRRFGRGDFVEPIPVTSEDEIGHLSTEANQMAARLRTTLDRLAETSAELARANEELESFSYSVAHDLRAPLRAINGYSTALLEDLGQSLEGEPKHYLERNAAAAERMGQLIDALLALSRVSRAELERAPVDLTALARAVFGQLRANAPERQVELVAGEDIIVNGDPTLLRALLENLLGNAWKFTARREAAQIELGHSEQSGTEAFFIRDNGAGFNMDYASRLFAPFQRLHPASEFAGTGIGLATVHRIVRRHGGRIWAEGVVDKGATFFFTLSPQHGGNT